MFSTHPKTNFDFSVTIILLSVHALNLDKSTRVHPFPYKPSDFCVSPESVLKTLWAKEKLLVLAISPFPTCLENFLPFSSNVNLLSAKSFSLEACKICCLGKG